MRAAVIHAPRDIRVEDRETPEILAPTDAVVRVVAACVCGSDLWPYRGVRDTKEPRAIGHEFVGVVEQVGDAAGSLRQGDFVIAPFTTNDGTCQACAHGMTSGCEHGSTFGVTPDAYGLPLGGAQAEYVRVPDAAATLVVVPGPVDDALVPSLLTLSDVFSTATTQRSRRASARARPSSWSATARSGCPRSSRRSGSAPSASSR